MTDDDLCHQTLSQAAALIRGREVSPIELTEAYLRRIDRLNPLLNAYITVTGDRAIDDAKRATTEIMSGTYRGPLHGIPVALKDVFATAGIRTTAASRILGDWIPVTDSTVMRKLNEAGAVLLGKLNGDELAYGGPDNPHFAPTQNPWDRDRLPGGSSGGAAAAIAAGMAVATLGTDTAGSIRIPAALCGTVGLKPTYGRVSKAGVVPLSASYDHVGPIARTVDDAAILLAAIAGYDPVDFSSVPVPVPDYATQFEVDLSGVRIGVLRPYFFDVLDPEVRATVEAAIAELASLGAVVRDVDVPLLRGGTPGLGAWISSEASVYHHATVQARPDEFGPDVLERLSSGPADGRTLIEGLQANRALAEQMRQTLVDVDVFVTPTLPIVAPLLGEETIEVDGERMSFRRAFVRCVAPFNATHLPALTVPCGFSAAGLPIGLQVVGRPFDELSVLRVGHAYERATTWSERHPAGVD